LAQKILEEFGQQQAVEKKKKAECENILQMALKEICTTWRDGMAESGEE